MNRRTFLQLSAGAPLALAATRPAPARTPSAAPETLPIALRAADDHGLMLPRGFRAREVARAGARVQGTDYEWPKWPDGGAVFATRDRGWIYVANSEVDNGDGAVSAVRFDADGEIVDAYAICTGTSRNCAGGATPWRTWLTCEEFGEGQVFECDPDGERPAQVRPALGRFAHEAVACDPQGRALYLTEDAPGGRLYRFTPETWEDLSAGTLEAARTGEGGRVTWVPADSRDATTYARAEGIAYHDGLVVFTTNSDDRIRGYDTRAQTMRVLAEPGTEPEVSGPDNMTFSTDGDLYVCEDSDSEQELFLITRDGVRAPVLRVVGHEGSELTGVALDPSGTHLYVSSQRGPDRGGATYEITGPFATLADLAPVTPVGSPPGRPDDTGGANPDEFPVGPVAGAAGGAVILGLAGLAWLRSRAGSKET